MIMEPVSDESSALLRKTERGKFTNEITKMTGKKRKRDSDASEDSEPGSDAEHRHGDENGAVGKLDGSERKKKKRNYGPKGPNPLSIKKKNVKPAAGDVTTAQARTAAEAVPKKKRLRKSKAKSHGGEAAPGEVVPPPAVTTVTTEA